MSRLKIEQEVYQQIAETLRQNGVSKWETRKTRRGHNVLHFIHRGEPRTLHWSGSGDWRARRNNVAVLKRVLKRMTQGEEQ